MTDTEAQNTLIFIRARYVICIVVMQKCGMNLNKKNKYKKMVL
jgi:hypothetical protein